jgi:homoserine O-succinyltransferase
MPIRIPNQLPATKILTGENIFVMTETRAVTQDIRPLQILVLNLMPTKIETETQLARLLGNTPLQVELELMHTQSYEAKNVPQEHMLKFYTTFDQVRHRYFDGMVITGAPVEKLEFEQVDYWQELCEIMEWSKTHVHSTFHICWGAQAGLYYHYGIPKVLLPEKLSGVFAHRVERRSSMLLRGFDDVFMVPHSRNTTIRLEDVKACSNLKILATSEKAGVYAISTEGGRQIFITGHSEYDADTLQKEYIRDKKIDPETKVPENYFPNDDDTQQPLVTWRSHANLIYQNWLNYFVYQTTPYDLNNLKPVK